MKKLTIFCILSLLIFFSGCLSAEEKGSAEEYCELFCLASLQQEEDISNGPCLSDDNPEWEYPDWVCDVAHNPREDVDNLPENQCQKYINGNAHHFVEVDTNCKRIRST
ncbi:MAG: hypothetical protein ABIF92_00735 [archaeon]